MSIRGLRLNSHSHSHLHKFFYFILFYYKDLQYLNLQKGLTLEGLSKTFKPTHTIETKRCGTRAP